MDSHPKAAMEWVMKVQDVLLQAMAKKITWWQAAEIYNSIRPFGYEGVHVMIGPMLCNSLCWV